MEIDQMKPSTKHSTPIGNPVNLRKADNTYAPPKNCGTGVTVAPGSFAEVQMHAGILEDEQTQTMAVVQALEQLVGRLQTHLFGDAPLLSGGTGTIRQDHPSPVGVLPQLAEHLREMGDAERAAHQFLGETHQHLSEIFLRLASSESLRNEEKMMATGR